MDFLNSKQVSEIFGCSQSTARDIMNKMPCFRPHGKKQGCPIYVRLEDFEEYIRVNTTKPFTPQPRPTEWQSSIQQQANNLKEWHRKKKH